MTATAESQNAHPELDTALSQGLSSIDIKQLPSRSAEIALLARQLLPQVGCW